ncbi:hypothetical protein A2526_05690 [candidate division WOR-1 bacterium RIFOXYD2_FULL_36_8]|uniref:ParB-like N-terminal domain-containing protein n=1 Tax=candidate division WOR-1 bacterium RIFOXYB2_FULL_36_35 TaxID=1802578 RepID=A0A1F4S2W4_UNCSA|nr:MAG: hypothetical protein A2230_07475 [candidate division WOR-1 bacterium RIFOXYA2_FULL_36_21]OGC14772.1 MAG: hypothetical protein A2290_08770 [candidate division WOR-1 bacterium RIFOXYB2_FULL_36_35]OGC16953.1 MAG: hypothetical protein A2282_08635 [candidate division WOR-1 bacterium RIFOXYA12_FULL_36_13]OGC37903.1 MAG: hypothetical protein A2526_05690 [candidate division WOR-1 bacterium RIFOXYD2_FULL_36_8]
MNKKGLGRGLSALIPEGSVFTGGRTIVNIPIDKVIPNPRQPRTVFNEDSLKELAESIKSTGVAQPILVRLRKGNYELVAGERRLRAAKIAGLNVIPSIIKDFSDQESVQLALIENLQREDLNPMDEAEAYSKLLSEFSMSQIDIANKVSKNRSTIANMLRLNELPEEMRDSLRKGEISSGHARALLSLSDSKKRLLIFGDIIKNKLSVRDVELIVYGGPKPSKNKKISKRAVKIDDELKPWLEKLTFCLATKVHLRGNKNRGRIEIDFFSQEDLERILDIILGEKVKRVEPVFVTEGGIEIDKQIN